MRALLVVNPQATSTTPRGRDVLAHALASAVKLDMVQTQYRGHAADLAARAAEDGYDLVVAHGGDGTVNEIVNGLLARGIHPGVPALGVVPGGSANVFARALGIDRDPVEATYQLLNAMNHGRSRLVGLGRADDRWFTFNAGLGWDADVVHRVEQHRSRGHDASAALYVRSAAAIWLRRPRRDVPSLTARLSEGTVEENLRLALLSNTHTWTYLGRRPVRTNPRGSFDSGLGLFALRSLGAPTVTRALAQGLRGAGGVSGRNLVRHDDVDLVQLSSSAPVGLQVDGDYLGRRVEVEFTAAPRALRVVL